jgi:hypothetical protein
MTPTRIRRRACQLIGRIRFATINRSANRAARRLEREKALRYTKAMAESDFLMFYEMPIRMAMHQAEMAAFRHKMEMDRISRQREQHRKQQEFWDKYFDIMMASKTP